MQSTAVTIMDLANACEFLNYGMAARLRSEDLG